MALRASGKRPIERVKKVLSNGAEGIEDEDENENEHDFRRVSRDG
jgi:hypothetical protein